MIPSSDAPYSLITLTPKPLLINNLSSAVTTSEVVIQVDIVGQMSFKTILFFIRNLANKTKEFVYP